MNEWMNALFKHDNVKKAALLLSLCTLKRALGVNARKSPQPNPHKNFPKHCSIPQCSWSHVITNSNSADHQVSIDHKTRQLIDEEMNDPRHTIFNNAQKHVYYVMYQDCYPRFLMSDTFKVLLMDWRERNLFGGGVGGEACSRANYSTEKQIYEFRHFVGSKPPTCWTFEIMFQGGSESSFFLERFYSAESLDISTFSISTDIEYDHRYAGFQNFD